jgi:hypothetical protein
MTPRLSSLSPQILGVEAGQLGLTPLVSTPWPVANRALLLPFSLDTEGLISSVSLANGAIVSGNFDVGIYNAEFQRLISLGGIRQRGINTTQALALPQLLLAPGSYWAALVADNATATLMAMGSLASAQAQQIGIVEASAAYPLPASLTPAQPTMGILPLLTLTSTSEMLSTFIADRIAPAWRLLTSAQKTAWHFFAVDNPILNQLGDLTSVTAFGMFVHINSWLSIANPAYILKDPPSDLITPQSFNLSAQLWPIKSRLADGSTDRTGKIFLRVDTPIPSNRLVIVIQPAPFVSALSLKPWPVSHSTYLPPGFSGLADLSTRAGYSVSTAHNLAKLRIVGPYLKGHSDQRAAKLLIVSTLNGRHVEGSILNSQ